MSDDLSAFFAKKKDKKKKNVVKMDDVGQMLERKARRQEEHDQQQAEDDKRNDDNGYRGQGEESEWIEYGESNQGRLEGLKIKDMGADSEVPEEQHAENEEQPEQQETTKTWGAVEHKKNDDESSAVIMAAYQKDTKKSSYVPPSLRRAGMGGGSVAANIDVTNEELFPTLAAASEIEKNKKEETKPGSGWGTVRSGGVTVSASENRPTPGWGGGAPPSASRGKESAIAALKQMASTGPAPLSSVQPAAAKPELHKAANSYVPPHLRNK